MYARWRLVTGTTTTRKPNAIVICAFHLNDMFSDQVRTIGKRMKPKSVIISNTVTMSHLVYCDIRF